MKSKIFEGDKVGRKLKIAVVTAQFNNEITLKLEEGALRNLKKSGLSEKQIVVVRVPGAFEIPLVVQKLLQKKSIDGVIALGAVIRGETTHYDYVCQAVERGCSGLSLKFKKPVGFGVLTTESVAQAKARVGGKHGHKGEEVATVVVEMCNLMRLL